MSQGFTPPSAIVTGARGSYFGDSGGTTSRYYWIQAIYAFGRSQLNAYTLVTTPAGLSNKNTVLLIWNAMPGAIGYNVFYTTTTTPPSYGAIAVALNQTQNSFVDIGQSDAALTAAVRVDGINSGLATAFARWSFAVDGGAISTITPAINTTIPKGAIIIGGTIYMAAAGVGASGTMSVGTVAGSSATALLGATAVASLGLNVIVNAVPVLATPVRLTAAGAITVSIATTPFSAGIADIFMYYVLPPDNL
jgi:hypothetical protein